MVYEYTKPRCPIAAMYSSPGPAYGLPTLVGEKFHDPRSVHVKYPAYSFGVRHGKFKDDSGPGPCYYPNPKVYRDGYDGTPHYSLYDRQKDTMAFKTPGPGAYCPENGGQMTKPNAPAYSFGTRSRHRQTDNVPAANSYTLPSMIGQTVQSGKPQAPCYSLRGRPNLASIELNKAPGPDAYNTTDPSVYKDKAPLYSITGRNMMPGDVTQKPGPGAHLPHPNVVRAQSPCYSFGIKHSPYLTSLVVDIPSIECRPCD
ncbi:outer dense fiber protein 3-B-like [Biomphalaria glabrata]|uniref:Outer dense fiber protein 3-B-like n=1 Tax=Biomphalaria glabrata TaxID=6526 RepID=A0A9W3AK28_BIOGL|nr:outer dense fiber protein 3-B-like [Biomphalaria glabrata]